MNFPILPQYASIHTVNYFSGNLHISFVTALLMASAPTKLVLFMISFSLKKMKKSLTGRPGE